MRPNVGAPLSCVHIQINNKAAETAAGVMKMTHVPLFDRLSMPIRPVPSQRAWMALRSAFASVAKTKRC